MVRFFFFFVNGKIFHEGNVVEWGDRHDCYQWQGRSVSGVGVGEHRAFWVHKQVH